MEPTGIAIWGAGWVAGGHLRAFLANPACRVVAVGSRREASCRALLAPHSLEAAVYTDLDRRYDARKLETGRWRASPIPSVQDQRGPSRSNPCLKHPPCRAPCRPRAIACISRLRT